MKYIIVTLLSLLSQFSLAETAGENFSGDILGRWKFVEYIYEGQKLPIPNRNLNLLFEFHETKSNRLWWFRDNEPGFCERIGLYTYENETLTDNVVWVNPDNHVECSQHPDMRMGQIAKNKVTFENGKLYLHLSLKGQPLIYVWEKQ
ncbi:MAG: hypothetical protein H6625_02955 [Bdellovibrionaceae bacterium]|nr:hypothetical protein [Pseudobdellovibrionaceae bacterium]